MTYSNKAKDFLLEDLNNHSSLEKRSTSNETPKIQKMYLDNDINEILNKLQRKKSLQDIDKVPSQNAATTNNFYQINLLGKQQSEANNFFKGIGIDDYYDLDSPKDNLEKLADENYFNLVRQNKFDQTQNEKNNQTLDHNRYEAQNPSTAQINQQNQKEDRIYAQKGDKESQNYIPKQIEQKMLKRPLSSVKPHNTTIITRSNSKPQTANQIANNYFNFQFQQYLGSANPNQKSNLHKTLAKFGYQSEKNLYQHQLQDNRGTKVNTESNPVSTSNANNDITKSNNEQDISLKSKPNQENQQTPPPDDLQAIQQQLMQINNVNFNKPQPPQSIPTQLHPPRPMTSKANSVKKIQQQHDNIVESLLGKTFSKGNSGNTLEKYDITVTLGQGSYAVVRLATDTQSQQKVAIKTYEKFKLLDPQKQNNLRREIAILQRLEHPNIIKLLTTIDTRTTVNLVMEFVGSKSLRQFLKEKTDRRMEEREARVIFQQIVSAIAYCHENQVIHRDIKLENILVGETTTAIKVIDFGFSIQIQEGKQLNLFCGTPSYMSPQLVSQKEYDGSAADVWALGILLFVILVGKFPFRGNNDSQLYQKITKCDYTIPSGISYRASNLISRIIRVRPQERLTARQILRDDWFGY